MSGSLSKIMTIALTKARRSPTRPEAREVSTSLLTDIGIRTNNCKKHVVLHKNNWKKRVAVSNPTRFVEVSRLPSAFKFVTVNSTNRHQLVAVCTHLSGFLADRPHRLSNNVTVLWNVVIVFFRNVNRFRALECCLGSYFRVRIRAIILSNGLDFAIERTAMFLK